MRRITVKEKHVESLVFILDQFINTHDHDRNAHSEDLDAAEDVRKKLLT